MAAKVPLNSEKEYKEFAKKVSKTLLSGNAPYHIDKFLKDLTKDLPEHCDSKQLKGMADNLMLLYNAKLKKEKSEDKNVKKKAPAIKGGASKGYDRNNNNAMIADVMGEAEEEDDPFAPVVGGFKRAEENEFDFM